LHQPQSAFWSCSEQQIHITLGDIKQGSDGSKRLSVEDQTINAAESSKRFFDDTERAITIGNIGNQAEALDVFVFKCGDSVGQSLRLPAGDDDLRSECTEMAGDAKADSASAASDDDNPAIKVGGGCVGHSRSVATVIAEHLDFVSS
jgi:hypothetical protein